MAMVATLRYDPRSCVALARRCGPAVTRDAEGGCTLTRTNNVAHIERQSTALGPAGGAGLSDIPKSGPPPGWYRDPQGTTARRWWNGEEWSDHLMDSASGEPPGGFGGSPDELVTTTHVDEAGDVPEPTPVHAPPTSPSSGSKPPRLERYTLQLPRRLTGTSLQERIKKETDRYIRLQWTVEAIRTTGKRTVIDFARPFSSQSSPSRNPPAGGALTRDFPVRALLRADNAASRWIKVAILVGFAIAAVLVLVPIPAPRVGALPNPSGVDCGSALSPKSLVIKSQITVAGPLQSTVSSIVAQENAAIGDPCHNPVHSRRVLAGALAVVALVAGLIALQVMNAPSRGSAEPG